MAQMSELYHAWIHSQYLLVGSTAVFCLFIRFADSKKNIGREKTDCQFYNVITSQQCNILKCYQQSAVGVYDIPCFVYSNMGFIKFSFMTLLAFVWLLAVTGRVDLL